MEEKIFINFDKIKSIISWVSLFFGVVTLASWLWLDNLSIKIGFFLSLLFVITNIWGRFFHYRKFNHNRPYLEFTPTQLIIQTFHQRHVIAWQAIQDINQDNNGDFIQADKRYAVSHYLLVGQHQKTIHLLKQYTQTFGTLKFIY